jgi:hypothetical protein
LTAVTGRLWLAGFGLGLLNFRLQAMGLTRSDRTTTAANSKVQSFAIAAVFKLEVHSFQMSW